MHKLRVRAGRKAMRFKERNGRKEDKEMFYECMRFEDKRTTCYKERG